MNMHADLTDDDLASALVSSCGVPTLLLDRNLTIRAASGSFCGAFDLRPELVLERELCELGGGEWDLPHLVSLLRTVATGHARVDSYEMDLKPRGREARRLLLKVARVLSGAVGNVHLLLSFLDQTELQAVTQRNDDLADENARLRRQLQLQIANSLQVIASILLHAARHTRAESPDGQFDDVRRNARGEAELQQLLSVGSSQVDMHSYLHQLCQSLRASMIPDGRKVFLEVRVDDTFLAAKEATCLGLIVTELAINAVRHAAFNPNFGQIVVSFGAEDGGWRLTIKDNGRPVAPVRFGPGLGMGIVAALALQLGAVHTVVSDGTGTTAQVVKAGGDVALTGASQQPVAGTDGRPDDGATVR